MPAERRSGHYQVLARLSGLLSSSLDLDAVLREMAAAAATLMDAAVVGVWVADEAAQTLEIRAFSDASMQAAYTHRRLRFGEGLPGWVAVHRATLQVDEVRDDPRVLVPAWFRQFALTSALAVPVLDQGALLGVLVMNGRTPFRLDAEDREILGLLVAQAALAMRSARLFALESARRRQTEVLAAIERELAAELDRDRLLDLVVTRAAALLDGAGTIYLLRDGMLVPCARTHPDAFRTPVTLGAGVTGRCAETGRGLLVNEYPAWPGALSPAVARGLRHIMAQPLRSGDALVGVITIGRMGRPAVPFHADDLDVLERFGAQAALALHNATLYEAAERRRQAAESLAEIRGALLRSLDLQEVAGRIVTSLRDLLGVEMAGVFRLHADSGDLVSLALVGETAGAPWERLVLPRGMGLAGLALRERRAVTTPDLLADPRVVLTPAVRASIESSTARAALALPLVVQDRVIGAVAVADRPGRVFDAEALRLAQALADQAAIALENARLYGEVRETRDFLRSIADGSPDAIVTTDPRGRITYWSPGAEQLFGYRADECHGRTAAEFYRGGIEAARTLMRRLRAARRLRNQDVAIRARDGRWVECSASLSILGDDAGAVAGVLSILKDVTEHRRLEAELRQAQKMEAVGRLAGGVAHDFNNLLAVIMGHGDLIQAALPAGDPLGPEVDEIRRAAERGAALTRQLLAFSRRQLLQPRPVDLATLVGDVAAMLRRLIGEDVELVLRLDPGTGRVMADPGQIEQVVVNLAVNARDAMPRGGRLTLTTATVDVDAAAAARHPDAAPGPHAMLALEDTGVGMTAEVRAHLFEPFFTTKEAGKGTGLGLSTVYGIVRQHRGFIEVDTEPGRGSTFRILLPRLAGPVDPARRGDGRAAAPRGTETILVVEDEPGVRELVRRVLAQHGYRVLVAAGGAEALIAVLPEATLDLLLTDVVMPGMSGPELAARLRQHRPSTRVLFVSGYTADALDPALAPAEEARLLLKPFTPAVLLRTVREVLDRPPPLGAGVP